MVTAHPARTPESFKLIEGDIETMETKEMSKFQKLGVRLAGPAAIAMTVFVLGAPVKWYRVF